MDSNISRFIKVIKDLSGANVDLINVRFNLKFCICSPVYPASLGKFGEILLRSYSVYTESNCICKRVCARACR